MAGNLERQKQEYFFCCEECREAFAAVPDGYAHPAGEFVSTTR
jgi:YHS domain-containing protein